MVCFFHVEVRPRFEDSPVAETNGGMEGVERKRNVLQRDTGQ
jgi:hypothetical protein